MASANRGSKTIDSVFVDRFVNATLLSDRWSAQLKTYAKNHQLYLAHLLRGLSFLEELEKHSIDVPEAILLEKKLNKLLTVTIYAKKHPKTAIFQHSMIKYRNYLLLCIYDLAIALDK